MLSGDTSTWMSGEQEGIYPATDVTYARGGGAVEGLGLGVAPPTRSTSCGAGLVALSWGERARLQLPLQLRTYLGSELTREENKDAL